MDGPLKRPLDRQDNFECCDPKTVEGTAEMSTSLPEKWDRKMSNPTATAMEAPEGLARTRKQPAPYPVSSSLTEATKGLI